MRNPRTRPQVEAVCDCPRAQHVHGTPVMYQVHGCGCDDCGHEYSEYRAGRRAFGGPAPAPISGQFVAAFPVHGGISKTRAARQAYDQLISLTREQGVVVKGVWAFQLERTPMGMFLTARAPAETDRSRAEVLAAAEHFAYEHERAHPLLARWVTGHLEGVAA